MFAAAKSAPPATLAPPTQSSDAQGLQLSFAVSALFAPAPKFGAVPEAPNRRALSFAPAPGRAATAFANSSASREAQARQLLIANGCWPPAVGQVFVIQIDQDAPPPSGKKCVVSPQSLAFHSCYSGQTCVFKSELTAEGKPALREVSPRPFTSAAHPAQANATAGYAGVAWVRSGVYTYNAQGYYGGQHWGYIFAAAKDHGFMPAARDLNHDGGIDAQEAATPAIADSILFHAGTSGAPRSVGCQTMPPAENAEFFKAVSAQKAATFTYLLIRRPNDISGENIF